MRANLACVSCLILSAGCLGRPLDPLGDLGARLEAWERRGEREPMLGARSTHRRGPTRTMPPLVRDDRFEAFCLTSHAMRVGSDSDSPTSPAAFKGWQPARRYADSREHEATTAAPGPRVSRRRAPLPGFWDTVKRDLRAMPGDLWDDTQGVYGSVPNLIILGLTYGGALAVQETGPDGTVEDSYRDHTTFSENARDVFAAAGNPGTHFALAGVWYLVGQQTQDDETYEVARTLFSALLINGLSTMVGQAAAWDKAPNGEWGTSPSGHTSSTFAFAAVMHEAYGPLVGVPLYGLGVLVALERLEDGEHYLSDVIMGGVMGLVIGHTVAGEHGFELFGGELRPYADPNTGSTGIVWVKHFK